MVYLFQVNNRRVTRIRFKEYRIRLSDATLRLNIESGVYFLLCGYGFQNNYTNRY